VSTGEHAREHGEDRPVGLGELCSFDLALEDDELVAQREDFGVALITRGEHPSEPGQDEFRDGGERVHSSATVSGRWLKSPESWVGWVLGTCRVASVLPSKMSRRVHSLVQDSNYVHAVSSFDVEHEVAANAVATVALANLAAVATTMGVLRDALDCCPDLGDVRLGLTNIPAFLGEIPDR
jgi:hypothetical protein